MNSINLHRALLLPMLCAATLLAGGFSRMGLGPQMALAVLFLVVVKMIEGALGNLVQSVARAWPAVYLPSVAGLAIAGALLAFAARTRRRPAASAGAAA